MRGRTVFEWVADPALLVQRWEVPLPEAPDGIAIIRLDDARGTYLQHYFDYLSPLEFSQRFTGEFDADGNTITGRWEISRDGSHWEHDFDLVYTRSGVEPVA